MPIIVYKSTRAARKGMSKVDRRHLHAGRAFKPLTRGRKRLSGRGSEGKITIRHRGGGVKRLDRVVDFGQTKIDVPARVERLEYDPNRSAFLALLVYADGDRRYRLAWEGAQPGDPTVIAVQATERPGNRMQLQHVTAGATVFDVEIHSGRGGRLFRAAGSKGILMDVDGSYAQMKMPSGEIRLIPKDAYATIGEASNPDAWLERVGSAGRKRRRGWRPAVRGKAMNPVDHPHGGGEGKQSIGLTHPKTPWGKPALGVKTRRRSKYSNYLVVKRRVKKKRK